MRRSFVRTPLACNTCRRRKTKCDGVRPRCGRCSAKSVHCTWSNPDPVCEAITSPTNTTPESLDALPGLTIHAAYPTPAVAGELDQNPSFQEGLHLCLNEFFDRHFASDFCSFDYRPDFEARCKEDALLSSAVIALCGRYLKRQDAQDLFGENSPRQVSRQHLHKARYLAKLKSDEPSVPHIQANLIVAMSELLINSGARHWLFSGTAIRMAEIMRLNKDFHQKHSLREQEIRRRVFWACLLMDRALAYLLAKHRTIALATVGIAVPGNDMSMAYGEETRGVTLENLASYRRASDLGLSPYLINSVCLWSNMAEFVVYSKRRLDWYTPIDPRSSFFIHSETLRTWTDGLPPSVCWSTENYRNQCGLGQKRSFVAMWFLLRSAWCVAHQCYLPHPTAYTKLVDLVDAAGWSYLHRDESVIKVCAENALGLGEMLAFLMGHPRDAASLQTVWVASSMLIAANTLLWLQYAGDNDFADPGSVNQAKTYFDLITQLLSSWIPEWKAAKQWLAALKVMHDLYKAAYLGEIDENILIPQDSGVGVELQDDGEEEGDDDFRPQPGDGYPMVISLPNLQASVKFATGDTSAKSISVPSIWLQLSGGWPYGFTSMEGLLGGPLADVDSVGS